MSGPRQRAPQRSWVPRFLELVRQTGNTRLSADGAGIDRSTPYALAARDPAFAAAWRQAQDDAVDILEAEARRRALAGSDGLLVFLLRSLRPSIYREAVDLRVAFQRTAERIAEQTGRPVEEVLERLERRAKELG